MKKNLPLEDPESLVPILSRIAFLGAVTDEQRSDLFRSKAKMKEVVQVSKKEVTIKSDEVLLENPRRSCYFPKSAA